MSKGLQTEVRRHRLTVDDFHRLGEAGILRADERVELIDGDVIDMAPIGSNHAGTVGFSAKRLEPAVGDAALVFVQNPLLLTASSEPQPDLMLLKPRADFYRSGHPRPEDVLLIIEVADTTLAYASSATAGGDKAHNRARAQAKPQSHARRKSVEDTRPYVLSAASGCFRKQGPREGRPGDDTTAARAAGSPAGPSTQPYLLQSRVELPILIPF